MCTCQGFLFIHILNFNFQILTLEALPRRPGVKSASSSLYVAADAEKFNPVSLQYAYPGTVVSLKQ